MRLGRRLMKDDIMERNVLKLGREGRENGLMNEAKVDGRDGIPVNSSSSGVTRAVLSKTGAE